MSSDTLSDLGQSTSDMIQKAASVLEEEVAAGIVAAREVERAVREEDEFSAGQFDEIMERLRVDTHEFVSIIGAQINELRSSEYDDFAERFQKDAHDSLDIILRAMSLAPELINRLLKSKDSG